MIEGSLGYVWAAYGATFAALAVLTLVTIGRLRHWARRARDLERRS